MLALLLCATPLAATSPETASSQKIEVSGGPLANFCVTNFLHSEMDGGRSLMKPGFGFGGFLDMGISPSFSIQFELVLNHKASDFFRLGKTGKFRYWGLEIPIFAMFHLNLPDGGRINAGIGPFTDFGLHASYTVDGKRHDVYERNASTGLSSMKDSYSGISAKLGYEFSCGLMLNCTYRVSLSNILDENSNEVRMFPQEMMLEAAYRF